MKSQYQGKGILGIHQICEITSASSLISRIKCHFSRNKVQQTVCGAGHALACDDVNSGTMLMPLRLAMVLKQAQLSSPVFNKVTTNLQNNSI